MKIKNTPADVIAKTNNLRVFIDRKTNELRTIVNQINKLQKQKEWVQALLNEAERNLNRGESLYEKRDSSKV